MKGDGAAPGPEGGGPGPAAPAPQTLLARCVLSAAGYIAGVGTIVVFVVSVCSSVSTSMSSTTSRLTSGSVTDYSIADDLAGDRRWYGNCLEGLRAALYYDRF